MKKLDEKKLLSVAGGMAKKKIKAAIREQENRKRMRISGKSVFEIKKIINQKKEGHQRCKGRRPAQS